jgi:four helix bundle protein
MNDFTEFDAFQLCRDFARSIAVPLNRGVFARDPVLVTQLRKTVISIYSNFAEGFERHGNREFSQFVSVAKGSVGEGRGQLLFAVDFGYLQVEQFEPINSLGQRASQCLGGLMRHLNTSEIRCRKFKFRDDRKR